MLRPQFNGLLTLLSRRFVGLPLNSCPSGWRAAQDLWWPANGSIYTMPGWGILAKAPVAFCFRAWHHVHTFFRSRKQLKQHCLLLKQERLCAITDAAARAPPIMTPARCIRFRGSHEELLNGNFNVWNSTFDLSSRQRRIAAPTSCSPILFTEDELVFQLSHTKGHKAVSMTSLPVIKALAPALGSWLHRFLLDQCLH